MQCPACQYQPTPQEHAASPEQCPSCSRFYAKATAQRQAEEAANAERLRAAAERAREINAAVKAGGMRLAADPVEQATRGLSGVQPVVVVDVQMRFMSMVRFMVMWAFASIPAALIVGLIVYAIFSMLGALP